MQVLLQDHVAAEEHLCRWKPSVSVLQVRTLGTRLIKCTAQGLRVMCLNSKCGKDKMALRRGRDIYF